MEKELMTTSEVARILGISRIAVFKKIKAGDIKATKVGRSFVIHRDDLPNVLSKVIGDGRKKEIERAVKKVVVDYGQTLKLLGKE